MNDQLILNEEYRANAIKKFREYGNLQRKRKSYKAYQCLKDKTDIYVLELLKKQFSDETVNEMSYALTNISFLRKVINKLAKVYSNGVKREIPDSQEGSQQLEEAAKYLGMNKQMRKSNKFYRTFRNTLAYPKPVKNGELYDLKVDILAPYNYDAIENPDNPEEAMAIVLSDFNPDALYISSSHTPDRQPALTSKGGLLSEGKIDTSAADLLEDDCEYIWWSKNYHFTTNSKGKIIPERSEGSIDNPILDLPFVNICEEQDGKFWAEGGDDLVEAGIKINTQITNMIHIGINQGHGQLYMTGKDLPKGVKVGPNYCIQLKQENNEDPSPTIGYLNANPQLAELRANVEMSVALMLTTNNLSTSGFSVSMSSGKDFASGIAMVLDKSESIEDVGEQSLVYVEAEPKIWDKLAKWYKALKSKNLLTEQAKENPIPENAGDVVVTFPSPKPIMSESEQLDNLKKRKDLGLNTQAELIQKDNPGMTLEEAKNRAQEILKENQERMAMSAANAVSGSAQEQGDSNAQPNPKPSAPEPSEDDQDAEG